MIRDQWQAGREWRVSHYQLCSLCPEAVSRHLAQYTPCSKPEFSPTRRLLQASKEVQWQKKHPQLKDKTTTTVKICWFYNSAQGGNQVQLSTNLPSQKIVKPSSLILITCSKFKVYDLRKLYQISTKHLNDYAITTQIFTLHWHRQL
jgi:hypothetical protein